MAFGDALGRIVAAAAKRAARETAPEALSKGAAGIGEAVGKTADNMLVVPERIPSAKIKATIEPVADPVKSAQYIKEFEAAGAFDAEAASVSPKADEAIQSGDFFDSATTGSSDDIMPHEVPEHFNIPKESIVSGPTPRIDPGTVDAATQPMRPPKLRVDVVAERHKKGGADMFIDFVENEPPLDEGALTRAWAKAKKIFKPANIQREMIDSINDIRFRAEDAGTRDLTKVTKSYQHLKMMSGEVTGEIRNIQDDFMKVLSDNLGDAKELRVSKAIGTLRAMEELAERAEREILENVPDGERYGRIYANWGTQKIRETLGSLRSKYGDELFARAEGAAREVAKVNNKYRLGMMLDYGAIDEQTAARLANDYKWYSPHKISKEVEREIFKDLAPDIFKKGAYGINLNWLKRGKGGKLLPDFNYFDRMMEGNARMLWALKRLRARRELAREHGIQVKFMKDENGNFRALNIPENYVILKDFIKGDGKVYAFSPEVYAAIKNLNESQSNVVTQAMKKINAPWKAMATAYNIPFSMLNAIRDTADSLINEKFGEAGVHAVSAYLQPDIIAESFWAAFSKNILKMDVPLYRELNQAGLPFGSKVGDGFIKQDIPTKFLPPKNMAVKIIGMPINLLSDIVQVSEQFNRIAQYKRLTKAGYSKEFAAMMGRDISVDASKMGHTGRLINHVAPFFNMNLQGVNNYIENVRFQPWTTASKALVVLSTLSSAYLYNKTNDEDFKKMSPEMSDKYLMVNSGIKKNGVPYFFAINAVPSSFQPIWRPIRKAMDIALEKSPVNKRILADRAKQDLFSAEALAEGAKTQFVSMLPPMLKIPLEDAANFDYYSGRDIIPHSKQNLPAELQSRPTTPNVYRLAGLAGVSPARAEHAVRGVAPAIKPLEGVVDQILMMSHIDKYLPSKVSSADLNTVDSWGKVIPFIKSGRYDQQASADYEMRDRLVKDRNARLELAKQSYRLMRDGDKDAADDYDIFYMGLDEAQKRALKRYIQGLSGEEYGDRPSVRSKMPKTIRKIVEGEGWE